jgi:hypothetical protein
VYNVLKEYNTQHMRQPPKVYHRKRSVLDNVDNETKSAIRGVVHSFFTRNEPPTVDKILVTVNENEDLPNFKKTTFKTLLKEIGFR